MANQIRRLQILIIIFIIMLITTRFYSHISPEWDPFQTTLDGTHNEISSQNDNGISTSQGNKNVKNVTKEESVNKEIIEHEPTPKNPKDTPFTILTGASENHFCPLKSFLYSTTETIKEYRKVRIIVYDLGLTGRQRDVLNVLKTKGFLTELRTFNWERYPSFWNINSVAKGEYAWKPGMINEVSREYPGIVIWLDSGTKIRKYFLNNMNVFLDKFDGFVSPRSPGNMKAWTHPGVYEYFNDDHKKYDKLLNCNGASIVFDTNRTRPLIDAWFNCALDKNCIAPPGSSRMNHRQDQALLTYLAAREGRLCYRDRESLGFHIHDDNNCKKENDEYEKEHDLHY